MPNSMGGRETSRLGPNFANGLNTTRMMARIPKWYRAELNGKTHLLQKLIANAADRDITLVYASTGAAVQ
jgi:hypothetical protein